MALAAKLQLKPGQSVALYDGTRVVGSATITASRLERERVSAGSGSR